jgi:hypothetical protein
MYINTIYAGQVVLARALAASFTAAPDKTGANSLVSKQGPQRISAAARGQLLGSRRHPATRSSRP